MNKKGKTCYGETTYPSWDTVRVELLQTRWDSLREWLKKEIINTKQKWGNKLTDNGYLDIAMTVRSYEIILDKMNELEGEDK